MFVNWSKFFTTFLQLLTKFYFIVLYSWRQYCSVPSCNIPFLNYLRYSSSSDASYLVVCRNLLCSVASIIVFRYPSVSLLISMFLIIWRNLMHLPAALLQKSIWIRFSLSLCCLFFVRTFAPYSISLSTTGWISFVLLPTLLIHNIEFCIHVFFLSLFIFFPRMKEITIICNCVKIWRDISHSNVIRCRRQSLQTSI